MGYQRLNLAKHGMGYGNGAYQKLTGLEAGASSLEQLFWSLKGFN